MKFTEIVEEKWKELKNWYVELVEIITELIKQLLLNLPKAILGIFGLGLFVFGIMTIGWWAVIIYVALMFLGVWIYYRFIEKTN